MLIIWLIGWIRRKWNVSEWTGQLLPWSLLIFFRSRGKSQSETLLDENLNNLSQGPDHRGWSGPWWGFGHCHKSHGKPWGGGLTSRVLHNWIDIWKIILVDGLASQEPAYLATVQEFALWCPSGWSLQTNCPCHPSSNPMVAYGGGLCRGREWVVQYRWRDKLEASFGVTLTLTLTVLQAMLLFFQFLRGSMLLIISGPITACFPRAGTLSQQPILNS